MFDYCYSMKSMHIGSELREFESYRDFAYKCDSLEKITVSPSNPAFKSIDNVLYDIGDKTLIRVPPSAINKDIVIPNWVRQLASCCFDGVDINKLIIKTIHDIGNIGDTNFGGAEKIYCVPGSPAEKSFNTYEYKTIPLVSEIDSFLNNISDNIEK